MVNDDTDRPGGTPRGGRADSTQFDTSGSTADRGLLAVRGDLDASTAPWLRHELSRLAGAGVARLDLDLSQVGFMDSSALGVLVEVHQREQERGGGLHLLGPSPACAKIFEITGLDHVFDIR